MGRCPSHLRRTPAKNGMRIHRTAGIPDAAALADAAACVARGGTLIFPTDTVYGIGCAPEDESAIEAIFAAKRRPPEKPLAIHVSRPAEARAFAARFSPGAQIIIDRFWPGPVTIIVERAAGRCAAAAREGPTIALRCPDSAACAAILDATGPLAATSANISGAPSYAGAEPDVRDLPEADVAIIAGPTKQQRESTVLDCSSEIVRVVRRGALDPDNIAAALEGVATLERPPQR